MYLVKKSTFRLAARGATPDAVQEIQATESFFYKDLALGVWSNIPNHPAPGGSQKSKQILGGLFSPRLEAILSKQIMESGLLT